MFLPKIFVFIADNIHKIGSYVVHCIFDLQHSQRQYYNTDGSERYSGTGYWLVDLDMNSPQSIEPIVPEVAAVTPTIRDCEKELYCGFPYLMPVTTFLGYISESVTYYLNVNARTKKKFLFYRKTTWIPGPAPLISIPTNLEVISKTAKQNIVTFTFNVTGKILTS